MTVKEAMKNAPLEAFQQGAFVLGEVYELFLKTGEDTVAFGKCILENVAGEIAVNWLVFCILSEGNHAD